MTAKIRFAIFIALAAAILAGCGKNNGFDDELSAQSTTFACDSPEIAVTNDGVYYTEMENGTNYSLALLMYYDFNKKVSVPLCSDPQCSHTDANICVAAFEGNPIGLFVNSKHNVLQCAEISNSAVYEVGLDGSGRETVGELGLFAADGISVHYNGSIAIDENSLFFSNHQRDGSDALYYLPLRQNAKPKKIYEAKVETSSEYNFETYLSPIAICGKSVFFVENDQTVKADGRAESGENQTVSTVALKYYRADTGEVNTIAGGYTDIAPYGEKYLLIGGNGFAVWEPAADTVEQIAMTDEIAALYKNGDSIIRAFYDDGKYYMLYSYERPDSDIDGFKIYVLDSELKLENTIECDYDGTLVGLQFNDEYIFGVGYSGDMGIYLLPKSELEAKTEITWQMENILP